MGAFIALIPLSRHFETDRAGFAPVQQEAAQPAPNNLAMRYIQAVQEGNTDEVVRMTLWMNERLERVKLGGAGSSELESVRAELCREAGLRPVEGNQLRTEGIEDKYLFQPGAQIEFVGVDAGRGDLEKPVGERTWVKVTYPTRSRAPLSSSGDPIRSLLAGVNCSRDGYVLKANVIGNAEVDRTSICCTWNQESGEAPNGIGEMSALQ